MKKIKSCIQTIKNWYNSLTASIEEGTLIYSLSDTQFFWITTVWLIMFPFVTYAVFWIGVGTWKEYLVFMSIEIVALAFKCAKYIKASGGSYSVEIQPKGEEK